MSLVFYSYFPYATTCSFFKMAARIGFDDNWIYRREELKIYFDTIALKAFTIIYNVNWKKHEN